LEFPSEEDCPEGMGGVQSFQKDRIKSRGYSGVGLSFCKGGYLGGMWKKTRFGQGEVWCGLMGKGRVYALLKGVVKSLIKKKSPVSKVS